MNFYNNTDPAFRCIQFAGDPGDSYLYMAFMYDRHEQVSVVMMRKRFIGGHDAFDAVVKDIDDLDDRRKFFGTINKSMIDSLIEQQIAEDKKMAEFTKTDDAW